jgi:hypothetical protein
MVLFPIFLMSAAPIALSIWTQVLQLASVPDLHLVRSRPDRLATMQGNRPAEPEDPLL